jgi:hypothetical protein
MTMPFEQKLIEAKFAMNRILPEELPALALDALEAGYDGPNLRRLTALNRPSAWEVDMFLPGAKQEMGMIDLSPRVAGLRLSQEVARQMLDGKMDIVSNLDRLERLWIDSDYPVELSNLGMLADEIEYSAAILRHGFIPQVIQELEELMRLNLG